MHPLACNLHQSTAATPSSGQACTHTGWAPLLTCTAAHRGLAWRQQFAAPTASGMEGQYKRRLPCSLTRDLPTACPLPRQHRRPRARCVRQTGTEQVLCYRGSAAVECCVIILPCRHVEQVKVPSRFVQTSANRSTRTWQNQTPGCYAWAGGGRQQGHQETLTHTRGIWQQQTLLVWWGQARSQTPVCAGMRLKCKLDSIYP